MPSEFEIEVRNTRVKIVVGGGNSQSSGGDGPSDASSDTASGGPNGGDGPSDASSETGSGTSKSRSNCCCEPVVIGPIIVSGSGMRSGRAGEQGGDGPSDASPGTASGGPDGGDGPSDAPTETGSGGPGSGGGCCCAPVVVGPIVFTGCCSDHTQQAAATNQQGAAKSLASPTSLKAPAIALGPPSSRAQGTAPSFVMEHQCQKNWCWAATAVAVHKFLDPPVTGAPAPPVLDQATLATQLMKIQDPAAKLNCGIASEAKSITQCNRPEGLDTALTITGNLRANGFLQNRYLSFADLQGWLNMRYPVCARIVWRGRGAGAHFIAIDACWVSPNGAQKVHVQDPLYGPGIHDYQTLVQNYRHQGYWHDTYLTAK